MIWYTYVPPKLWRHLFIFSAAYCSCYSCCCWCSRWDLLAVRRYNWQLSRAGISLCQPTIPTSCRRGGALVLSPTLDCNPQHGHLLKPSFTGGRCSHALPAFHPNGVSFLPASGTWLTLLMSGLTDSKTGDVWSWLASPSLYLLPHKGR